MPDQAENLRHLVKGHQAEGHSNVKDKLNEQNTRVITVCSGKGGVGKSNVVVNIGLKLIKRGFRVLIIDADFGFANVDVLLGKTARYNFMDVLNDELSITDIIEEGPGNLKFITGAESVSSLLDSSDHQVHKFIKDFLYLSELFDVIMIDTGAGINKTALSFMEASTEIIVVTTPEPTSITDAYSLIKTMKQHKLAFQENIDFSIIVNCVEDEKEGEEIFDKISKVVERFLELKLQYLGCIPFDIHLKKAVKKQQPVSIMFPNSTVSCALDRISDKIAKIKEVTEEKPLKSFLRRFLVGLTNNK